MAAHRAGRTASMASSHKATAALNSATVLSIAAVSSAAGDPGVVASVSHELIGMPSRESGVMAATHQNLANRDVSMASAATTIPQPLSPNAAPPTTAPTTRTESQG